MTLQAFESHRSMLATVLSGRTLENQTVEHLGPISFRLTDSYIKSCLARPRAAVGLGIVEGVGIIGGVDVSQASFAVCEPTADYADYNVLRGSYGPLTARQTPMLIHELQRDKLSRRAVLTVRSPEHSWSVAKDIPCTLSVQFLRRRGVLNMHVSMRSNDAWMGHVYDVVCWRLVQQFVAEAIGSAVGNVYWTVGSMHVYQRHIQAAREWIATVGRELPKRASRIWELLCSNEKLMLEHWAMVQAAAAGICADWNQSQNPICTGRLGKLAAAGLEFSPCAEAVE